MELLETDTSFAYPRPARVVLRLAFRLAPLFLALALIATRCNAEALPANQVKAAFIYNFLKFVEWPGDSFPIGSTELVLCTLGDNPLGGALDPVLKSRTVGERKLAVKHLASLDAIHGCQALFIDQSEAHRLHAVLAALTDATVLTISDTQGFIKEGGCIGLTVDNDRVRFSVSLSAARTARLVISSKLLALALDVRK